MNSETTGTPRVLTVEEVRHWHAHGPITGQELCDSHEALRTRTEAQQQELTRLTQGDSMIPTIGRIVHFRITTQHAAEINRRRTTGAAIAERLGYDFGDPRVKAWPVGAQAHIGNEASEGQTYPMLITRAWGNTPDSAVNGQVFLDGNDVLWATSVVVGEGPNTFSWPTR
jgi:hypothetical protein